MLKPLQASLHNYVCSDGKIQRLKPTHSDESMDKDHDAIYKAITTLEIHAYKTHP